MRLLCAFDLSDTCETIFMVGHATRNASDKHFFDKSNYAGGPTLRDEFAITLEPSFLVIIVYFIGRKRRYSEAKVSIIIQGPSILELHQLVQVSIFSVWGLYFTNDPEAQNPN